MYNVSTCDTLHHAVTLASDPLTGYHVIKLSARFEWTWTTHGWVTAIKRLKIWGHRPSWIWPVVNFNNSAISSVLG